MSQPEIDVSTSPAATGEPDQPTKPRRRRPTRKRPPASTIETTQNQTPDVAAPPYEDKAPVEQTSVPGSRGKRRRRRGRSASSRPAASSSPDHASRDPEKVAAVERRKPSGRVTGSSRTGRTGAKKVAKTPSKRKPTGRGRAPLRLPARTRPSSEFGTHWWARRWLAALERFGWTARLERGRDYARRGNVLDIDIKPGVVTAAVQGSRPWPYKSVIGLQTLNDEQWDRVIKRLGRQALYAAKLLAGDMPQNIEDIFNAADVPLIPRNAAAFTMECTCPDPVNPCKHIAAVHYVLSTEFDRDPFVLFELRGRSRHDIVKALQGRPEDQTVNALPLVPTGNGSDDYTLDTFWRASKPLSDFEVHIAPAPVPGGLVKRLGPLPIRGQTDEWRQQLFDVYRLVSRRAYALGRGDDPGD